MLIHILSAWMLNAFQVVSTPQYKKKKNQKQPNIRKVETNEQWAHHKITWLYYLLQILETNWRGTVECEWNDTNRVVKNEKDKNQNTAT